MVGMADKTVACRERFVLLRTVRAIGPDARAGVGFVRQSLARHSPVMAGGIRDIPTADEAERFVDACVVLVPERRNYDVGRRGGETLRPVRRAS